MSWVPDWAQGYVISRTADQAGIIITFRESPGRLGKPISELAKDLAISDVCQQIRERKTIDDVSANEWTEASQKHFSQKEKTNLEHNQRYKAGKEEVVIKSKYHREIKPGVWVDVYQTCGAFMSDIKHPLFPKIRTAVDHAAKKILALGERGHKDLRTDLIEAKDSIEKAISDLDEWL